LSNFPLTFILFGIKKKLAEDKPIHSIDTILTNLVYSRLLL
jgi:hypothetical protein